MFCQDLQIGVDRLDGCKLDNQTVRVLDPIMLEVNGGEMAAAGQEVPSKSCQ